MNGGAPSTAPVISLDGLTVRLGRRVILDDLRAELTGRAVGLLGPNGAGKTTLLRTLLGFFPASGGSARVLGRDVAVEPRQVRESIGYMPESDAHIGHLTAVRMVRMMAELSGLPHDAALERAHEALFWVGLGEARYRKVGTFSTGMKQKVKLAQAIVHGPRLLMLDEPTNGLDPAARRRMLDLITEIRDRGETTLLLSSHLLKDVEGVCDQVLILKQGRIAAVSDLAAERRTDRSFVELELGAPCPQFVEALQARGCELAIADDSRLKAVLPEGVTVRTLLELAASEEVVLRRLNVSQDSLQDIFLRVLEDDRGGV